jgi:hypothetical protein
LISRFFSAGDVITSSQAPKPAPQKNLSDSRAATVPKKTDGTFTNRMATREPNNVFGTDRREPRDAPISSAQIDTTIQLPKDDSGIIKCQTCDLYFKKYSKPQYNEINFLDGDLHCDKCYNFIVDSKAAAWKLAFPAGSGILSTKRRVKQPLKVMPLGNGEEGAVG